MTTSIYSSVPWLTSTNSTASTTSSSTSSTSSLGKDDFLKLLITQLQTQDPLDPMDDKEFISQMASFSSLEQMQNLNTSFTSLKSTITDSLLPSLQLQQASSLIGQEVSYPGTDEDGESTTLTGTVDKVVMDNGTAYCVINDTKVEASSITAIGTSYTNSQLDEVINELNYLLYTQMSEEGADSDS